MNERYNNVVESTHKEMMEFLKINSEYSDYVVKALDYVYKEGFFDALDTSEGYVEDWDD